MTRIVLNDVTKIFPFVKVSGLFGLKEKQKLLEKQKQSPYLSNEGVIAVQHFSLTVEEGSFTVLVGPSGSGKTTALRMIAGLEQPTVGEIYFDNEDMSFVKPEDRDVAMVFQNYSLYPNQTVYENIAFPLKNQHMVRQQLDEKVNEIAELLKLSNKLERLPNELSGGEKQRVAIARALVRKPRVFLLDEPFSNLDEQMRTSLCKEIKRIQKRLGITFIYVTHNQNEALYLADQLVVMNEGKIIQQGSTADIFNHPVNTFVATFLGSPTMNLFGNIPINRNSSVWSYQLFGKVYSLTAKQKKHLKASKSLMVGVRPSNVYFSANGIVSKIEYTEIIGADTIIYLETEGIKLTMMEKFNENRFYMKDQEVQISIDEDYFYLFDQEGNLI